MTQSDTWLLSLFCASFLTEGCACQLSNLSPRGEDGSEHPHQKGPVTKMLQSRCKTKMLEVQQLPNDLTFPSI